MDTGKLNNNTVFYDGYEGEGEIILSVAKTPNISLHIWDGYFEDIFGHPLSVGTGWQGFTLDYQESIRTFSNARLIPLEDVKEYILDLRNYQTSHFSYPETTECLKLLIELFEYASAHSSDIAVDIL